MADPNITRVNTVPYSWTSTAHFFAGFPYKGLTAVDYEDGRECEEVGDAHQSGVPIGITSGVYKVNNFKFTMLRDSAFALMQDLAALTGSNSYGDCKFNFIQQLFEPINNVGEAPSAPQTTLITGCRITAVAEKAEYGSGKLVTEFTCKALFITRGGLTLWSQVRALL